MGMDFHLLLINCLYRIPRLLIILHHMFLYQIDEDLLFSAFSINILFKDGSPNLDLL